VSGLSLALAVLACAACTSHPSPPPVDGGPDGMASDAGPLRTATTRALLPTSVDNVLIDPFVTSETGAYHFRAIPPPSADPSSTSCPNLVRAFTSFSPVGVSAPVLVTPGSTACPQILAPFSGGNGPDTFTAQIWVALFDPTGQTPLALPTASALDPIVTATLLPNTLPGDPPADAYPLTLTDAGATTLGDGSAWGLLSVGPVSLPKGGWFLVQIGSTTATIELAAPQVVPTTEVPLHAPRHRPITQADRAAVAQYAWLVKNRPKSRPRTH
jgi:hypothetical protein